MNLYDNENTLKPNVQNQILKKLTQGKIIIYPTDTVMGIGCDATNQAAIEKIKQIKKRAKTTMLVIAPSIDWIKNNTEFKSTHLDDFELPGPYSFLVTLKDTSLISAKILGPNNSLGVRLPKCNMLNICKLYGKPIITTSVNISGKAPAISINDIDKEILKKTDVLIRESTNLSGKSSELYDIRENNKIQLR